MHASQLRRHGTEIEERGARIVAVGTGDAAYARAFVRQERFPHLVLLDEDGAAAAAAALKIGGARELVGPRSIVAATKGYLTGHFQHRLGVRPKQLGATFVIEPGDVVRYEHVDRDVADHAPLREILAALGS